MITEKGYQRIYNKEQHKLRMLHDMVWENIYGEIPEGFQIHHKDFDKLNNDIENLEMVDTVTHKRIHSGCKIIKGEWFKPCCRCKRLKNIKEYYKLRNDLSWVQSICKECQKKASILNKKIRKSKNETE